ncbi:MAG: N-acetyltransferase family protein [Candidatus Gracilibacteria bacterium]|jgi:phosphinothricin acetyltransferase
MDYKILKAKKGDLKDILNIYNYYIENSTATYYTHRLSLKEMEEKVFFKNKKYGTFVIVNKENDLIGYCILGQYNKKEGYDNTAEISIYIKPNFTQKGLGSRAMNFLEKQAEKHRIHVLIGAVTQKNMASQKLFQKCGYKQCAYFQEIGFKFGEILNDVYFQKILKTRML